MDLKYKEYFRNISWKPYGPVDKETERLSKHPLYNSARNIEHLLKRVERIRKFYTHTEVTDHITYLVEKNLRKS